MKKKHNKLLLLFISLLAGGALVALSLLQLINRAQALISSVSWNL